MNRKLKPSVPDTRSVDIEDEYAVAYWSRELSITQTRLKAAVKAAGTAITDVKKQLKLPNTAPVLLKGDIVS